MEFTELPQYKKGKIGEDIVRKMLQDKGWITYTPEGNKAHYFDILATKDKKSVIALDVKTKARFNKWPAQGIDLRHYEEYMNFVNTTQIPFFVIFVDDKNGDIHSAELAKLKNPFYPSRGIIAWMLADMKKIGQITDKEILADLSQFDTRNYDFKPENIAGLF